MISGGVTRWWVEWRFADGTVSRCRAPKGETKEAAEQHAAELERRWPMQHRAVMVEAGAVEGVVKQGKR